MSSSIFMQWLFYFLLLCNVIIPMYVVMRYCVYRSGIIVDHIFLFSCGFVFYFILPFFLGIVDYYDIYFPWHSFFGPIKADKLIAYMFCCLVFYISYISGTAFYEKIIKKNNLDSTKREYYFDKKLLNIPLLISAIAAVCFAFPLRDYFFSGHRMSPLFVENGQFTAATILLLSLAFMYSTKVYEEHEGSCGFWRTILNQFSLVYLIFLILLISLGGRLVLISTVLMLLVFFSVYFHRIKIRSLLLIVFAIIMTSHLIMILRIENFETLSFTQFYAPKDIALRLFSENFNVSLSLLDFLSKYDFPLIRFPHTLLSSFVSIIPSFIFPSKNLLIVLPHELGYEYVAPAGGVNSFISLMINFGILGTVLFLFFFSFFLCWIKNKSTPLHQTMYIMISGWLAMSFFRAFEMTAVKMILEFSILVPITLTVLCSMINKMDIMRLKNTNLAK